MQHHTSGEHAGVAPKHRVNDAVLDLIEISNTITEDGRLLDGEVSSLRDWSTRSQETDFPGRVQAIAVANRVLENQVVSDGDRTELYSTLERALPHDLRSLVQLKRPAADAGRDRPIEMFDFMLAGSRYDEHAHAISRFAMEGDEVLLVRHPESPLSRNAICVRLLSGQYIGYVPEAQARTLAPLLDDNLRYTASIQKILRTSNAAVPIIVADVFDENAQLDGLRRPNDQTGRAAAFRAKTPARGAAKPKSNSNYNAMLIFVGIAFALGMLLISI